MFEGSRVERQNVWGLAKQGGGTTASSPGEDLPPIPSNLNQLGHADSLPVDSLASQIPSGTAPDTSRETDAAVERLKVGSGPAISMERQASAGNSIGGIEWVDWYDCYRRYKEAKMRAEAENAKKVQRVEDTPAGGKEPSSSAAASAPVAIDYAEPRPSPKEIDLGSNFDASSAIALTPQTSRDEMSFHTSGNLRRRSMSIRSTISSLDPSRSPTQRRASIFERASTFERPRQTSGSSTRSMTDSFLSHQPGVKKKKNLVTKMEGWWNAVKSNFIPEGQSPPGHRPLRPSNLGAYPAQRIPSAPASRRGSNLSPITTPPTALLAPEPVRSDSSHSLRPVVSHSEIRPRLSAFAGAPGLQAAVNIVPSASADLARVSIDAPFHAPEESTRDVGGTQKPSEEAPKFPGRLPSSLEARRRGQAGGANLRLELESNVLTDRPESRTTSSSGSNGQRQSHLPAHVMSSYSSSRSSSYGQTQNGPGLTPGVPRWDATPSPIYPVSTASQDDKDDKPVAPGAEITVASVRRHIKHRLNAAKETCDNTLKKAIDAMTKFADEQKAKQVQAELEDQSLDYFDVLSDSPLVDAEESEIEGGDLHDEGFRSRQGTFISAIAPPYIADLVASTSRPPSRRPSISRPMNMVTASPNKRLAMLPSSPSRLRRRPSAAPRSFPSQQRLSRNMSFSLDRTVSAASSRSTSRSRSPMPSATRGVLPGPGNESLEESRKFLAALQDLIVLAAEVLDSSVNSLVSKPGTCAEIVQKLQRIGQNWDEHDDWPGREWYVDILMAVANLSRVLDWWQAEKGFWNFDEEDANEPIVFVMKPGTQIKEDSRFDQEFGAALSDQRESPANILLHDAERPLSGATLELPSPSSSALGTARQGSQSADKAMAAEDLQYLAEHAKSVNIVMELSLQGEEIQYVNDAILEVIG
jgi:serine/threonine-protein kinase RIM15